jgi:hypothetical protein
MPASSSSLNGPESLIGKNNTLCSFVGLPVVPVSIVAARASGTGAATTVFEISIAVDTVNRAT